MKILRAIFATLFGFIMIALSLVLSIGLLLQYLPSANGIDVISVGGVSVSVVKIQAQLKDIIGKVFTSGMIDKMYPKGLAIALGCSALLHIALSFSYKAGYRNSFIGIAAWLNAIVINVSVVGIFILSGELNTVGVVLTNANKIGIAVCVGLYMVVRTLSGKVGKLIDRRIQAYDTAIEAKQVGRSSPLLINTLKAMQFMFPEMIIIALLALMNKTLAPYFYCILISVGMIVISLSWSDSSKRADVRRQATRDKINQVRAIEKVLKS